MALESTVKLIASETLMCGLKKIPFGIGTAIEVVEAVRTRHEFLGQSQRLAEVEGNLSRVERRLRDMVAEEIRTTLETLGRPNVDGATLNDEVRNLREIRSQGWSPTLFEGLLRNSNHWDKLLQNPQNYGELLDDDKVPDAESIQVLLDAGRLRVLQLRPFAFASLLSGQTRGVPKALIQQTDDIWAFAQNSRPGKTGTGPLSGRPKVSGPLHEFDITKVCVRVYGDDSDIPQAKLKFYEKNFAIEYEHRGFQKSFLSVGESDYDKLRWIINEHGSEGLYIDLEGPWSHAKQFVIDYSTLKNLVVVLEERSMVYPNRTDILLGD